MLNPEHLVKNVTPDASPQSVMWANFVAPIFARSEPHVRSVPLDHVDSLEQLVPFATIEASFKSDEFKLIEASGPHSSFLLLWNGNHDYGSVLIRATTAEEADKAEAEIRSRRPPVPTTEESVRLDFWQTDGSGDPYTSSRAIEAPDLATIATNYPREVLADIERLSELQPAPNDGRIVLWHGPPGTGKTSAIRAVAKAWGERIRVQVLLDPERVLASSATLMSVLLDTDTGKGPAGWRLLVIEDADELLRADAKDRVGQALSRLLNLSDGLLGQGSKVLVLVTTNEPIGRIHPALIRPGRCLMESEFRRFTRAEAASLSDRPLPAGASFSLAELTAIRDGRDPEVADDFPAGTYL